ncbi:type II toxin-antitoxin system VapB family antitoxin [Rhizobium sp. 32-5/1]|uniref:type II toxin-antitoxin system VapB family antitoxin n=1 Tax=Rhizobium sp. 32-5/1 TaxID=3019602 RepID=UPI00240E7D91|nr:type II toxin-antitoxin system VapB family antitoxin [Rhizobium sp. 32-5/1]WEZ84299.1 type II toxin-antitoxin system VapB family antitoxin [Rhizobium sp. 32-5/1]
MSLNVKDPEAHRLAQAIAHATGLSMSRVVTDALRERYAQIENREAGRLSKNFWQSPTGPQPI